MFATRSTSKELKDRAKAFLKAMKEGDFDKIWQKQITQEAANFLAATLFAVNIFKEGDIEKILQSVQLFGGTDMSILDVLSCVFHMDFAEIRTSFLWV